MKTRTNWLLMFVAAIMLFAVTTQTASAQETPQRAFAAAEADDVMSSKDFREEVAKGIVQAAQESDNLNRFEKRRIERVMKGRWWNASRKEAVLDHVVKTMVQERQVEVLPGDGVMAATNWDDIFGFIERLIPLIMNLISLFGG